MTFQFKQKKDKVLNYITYNYSFGEVIFVVVVQVGQPNQLKYIIALRNDKKSFYRCF